jgi:hypothetical protein
MICRADQGPDPLSSAAQLHKTVIGACTLRRRRFRFFTVKIVVPHCSRKPSIQGLIFPMEIRRFSGSRIEVFRKSNSKGIQGFTERHLV